MIVLGMLLFLVPLAPAFAQLVSCGGIEQADGACAFCDIFATIAGFFNFLVIQVTAPLATLTIIIGGLIMMFGGSSPALLGRAKAVLKGTFIGIAIVLLAWIIVNTTINVLTNTSTPDGFPWPWHTPNCPTSTSSSSQLQACFDACPPVSGAGSGQACYFECQRDYGN